MVLDVKNVSLAQQALEQKAAANAAEARRLIEAGIEIMRTLGTTARPRVADIAKAAGLSNDAFYRHFASKDALITALLEDGADSLHRYLTHQMAKERTPQKQVLCWVRGVLSQTDPEIATTTLAILWNAGTIGDGIAAGPHLATSRLAPLLHEPFAALGSTQPERDASLAAHAVLGMLADHLWRQTQPDKRELEHYADFCINAASGSNR